MKRIQKRLATEPHPTKVALLEVVKEMIGEFGADGFTVEMVLAESGISRGSLYHHFEDFPDLVEEALLDINRTNVVTSIELVRHELAGVRTKDEFLDAVGRVTRALHSPERFKARVDRVRMLAVCGNDERFRKRFGDTQAEVIMAFADVIADAQARGVVRADFDPKVLATFMSAYTTGVILNDVSSDPVSYDDWNALVADVIERFVS
ncbi:MAG: TetR/AcrR family transcriptional regulator [Actinomycetota bacterium]|nr:TetR/AcrR family transcriptional regulator [Actinomycetota bacterium]MDA2971053.1 TetR/AcrR family transcriptional regulator [Actinomycetota bacterium]MDA3000837.1 TetR/AcrR family transcriptional regulator [Actinomycetota bacterium]